VMRGIVRPCLQRLLMQGFGNASSVLKGGMDKGSRGKTPSESASRQRRHAWSAVSPFGKAEVKRVDQERVVHPYGIAGVSTCCSAKRVKGC
jgi:hypothetical protein